MGAELLALDGVVAVELVAVGGVVEAGLELLLVVGVVVTLLELLPRRGCVLDEAKEIVGRHGPEGLARCRADLRILVRDDGEQGPQPVVPLEGKQAAGGEEAQVARRVRRTDDRDETPGFRCGRMFGLGHHEGRDRD